ncbi:CDP-diacylglycerol pyrophosphatase [Mycobacterium sp. JS623]|uniref:CDP-diacylglycerol diphosphatase n=1 Tax=Mycobacterium sp. JS623 TaxID=212767 RepID=UPI0002A5B120|nr:CDP-diacylglycerol diphosphatase [Mycobacterium sp. JS623]AGB23783.1 CDP-diacylglycerol pyrophosphatase [Mycobacterium sp. JS623]
MNRRRWFLLASALIVLTAGVTAAQANADPNALWTIVHDQCVPDQLASGDPAPCARVDIGAGEQRGSAVLKDLVGATQFLLIPTERIPGIESPTLLEPDAPNFFAAAWDARSFVNARAGIDIPRDWMSLAINSAVARSQNQLHIHIDCVRADIRETVNRRIADVGPDWAPFPEPLRGHPYQAMAVEGDTFDVTNPVQLLAKRADDMGLETLVVIGAYLPDGRPGFVLLASRADPAAGNPGAGEELQDHTACPPPRGQWAK